MPRRASDPNLVYLNVPDVTRKLLVELAQIASARAGRTVTISDALAEQLPALLESERARIVAELGADEALARMAIYQRSRNVHRPRDPMPSAPVAKLPHIDE